MNSSHASAPPAIETIVESAIYADDLDRLESFYSNLLGLPVLGREKDRHVFFRVGSGSVPPKSAKISANTGTTLISRKIVMLIATIETTEGYITADFTLR